jgi:membrane protease YdiL (CAAX protease family)
VDEPAAPSLEARRIARHAVLATVAVYGGYGILGMVGLSPDLRYLGLVACFYLLPGWILRRDPARAERWQVGPGGVIPKWSRKGGVWAAIMIAIVFPPFVLAFLWFYQHVCVGDLRVLAPVIWVEDLTPWPGGLEKFLARLCRGHDGTFWPDAIRLPDDWLKWGGAGAVLAVVVELFAIALPEEVFHRGYLMSALEEVWKPKRSVLGAKIGLAAVVASLLFAVGHLFGMAEAARLATFFPALLFSWLWKRSGSLWAPAIFHAAANLLMSLLIASTFAR